MQVGYTRPRRHWGFRWQDRHALRDSSRAHSATTTVSFAWLPVLPARFPLLSLGHGTLLGLSGNVQQELCALVSGGEGAHACC